MTRSGTVRFTPLAIAGAGLQAAIFLYIGALTGVLDLLSRLGRTLLPAARIDGLIERAARAAAPHVLADERDWPMLPVLASVSVLVPASFALQFAHLRMYWLVPCVVHHAVLLGARGKRYERLFSVKHNEAHRPRGFFRGRAGRLFGRYTELFSSVFCGNIFGLDFIHHVKIHHAEDGGPDDPQSTHDYDRTSPWHFLHFLGSRHLGVTTGIATLRYLGRNGRRSDRRLFVCSTVVFYGSAAALLWYDWHIALAVAIGPLLISNVFAGMATWLQHSFDVEGVEDPIANTVTLFSPTEFLNEGYHLAHHFRSGTHWSDLPQRFEEWCARNPQVSPMVLDGVDWVELALLLYVRRRLDLVAEYWKPLAPSQANLSVEWRTQLLRERLGGASG